MLTKLLVGLVALPWTILVGVVRLLLALIQIPWRWHQRSANTLSCPSGHRNAVLGRWTCACGAAYLGHAFGKCPVCRMPAGWMRCEQCGLAIRSPWRNER